jgi:hypothetical protein
MTINHLTARAMFVGGFFIPANVGRMEQENVNRVLHMFTRYRFTHAAILIGKALKKYLWFQFHIAKKLGLVGRK